MFIHLGGDIVVSAQDIIAILDYSKKDMAEKFHSFIDYYKQQEKIMYISETAVKSIIISDKYIYFSPISSLTLNKRVELNQ